MRIILLLAITSTLFPQAQSLLRLLETVKDYEQFKQSNNQHVIYSFQIADKWERNSAIGSIVRDSLKLVDQYLDALGLDVRLAYVDCSINKIDEFCNHDDDLSNTDFFAIKLVDNRRETHKRLQPIDSQLFNQDLIDMILRFFSAGWKNYHSFTSAQDIRRTIEANPGKDWFVCHVDPEHKMAKTFCLELAATYRKRAQLRFIHLEKISLLQDLNKHMNLELDPGSSWLAHRIGLWFLDCLEDEEGVRCKSFPYLLDESLANAKHFVEVVRYPPVMEMSSDGSIPKLQQKLEVSLLYCFYRGTKMTWDTAKIGAFDVVNRLRGTLIVIVADIDELNENTLRKFGLKAKGDGSTPVWKLRLISREDEDKSTAVELHHVTGCPVEFVKDELKAMYNKDDTTGSTGSIPDSSAKDIEDSTVKNYEDSDQNNHADKLEPMEDFHPTDFKRVIVLTEKTYNSFIEKRKTALVLFWLNVEPASWTSLSVTIDASAMLDTNYAPFGVMACHDWPDVCHKASIKSWPKLIVFSHGERMREYKGVWEPKVLANSAVLYDQPPVTQINSATALEDFIHSKTVRLTNNTYLQTITVGIFKNDKARQIRALNDAAKRLHGQYAFGVATGAWTKNWVNDRMGPLELPVIVTHKNDDELEKAVLMDNVEDATPESITRFVQISSRPVIASLTKVSFPSIIDRKVPIIILMGANPTKTKFFEIMRNVEQCLLSRNYVCVTLDTDAEKQLASHLLKAYGLDAAQLPAVVYVNPKNGHVHLLPNTATQQSIKIWLEHINSKMLKPSVVLPEKTWSQAAFTYDYSEQPIAADSGCPYRKKQDSQQQPDKERGWHKKKDSPASTGQPGKAGCPRKKPSVATGHQTEAHIDDPKHQEADRGWQEAHECPYKKMAEEARRNEEAEGAQKDIHHEHEEIVESNSADQGISSEEFAEKLKKITKDVQQKQKRVERGPGDHEEGRDEL